MRIIKSRNILKTPNDGARVARKAIRAHVKVVTGEYEGQKWIPIGVLTRLDQWIKDMPKRAKLEGGLGAKKHKIK